MHIDNKKFRLKLEKRRIEAMKEEEHERELLRAKQSIFKE